MSDLVQIDHKDRSHCEHGPSGASRWIACPGSIMLSRGIPQRTSAFAEEGTRAHELAEKCISQGANAEDYAQQYGTWKEGITEEMVEHVQLYVDYIRELALDSEVSWIERRVSLARLNPPVPMDGTADCIILKSRTLHVIDLKYGQGVPVEVKDNPQLKMYGAAALMEVSESYDVDKVVLTIVQPRAPHADGKIRSVEIDPVELIDFALDLIDAAKATLEPNAPLVAGKHCRWCLALPQCPEARKTALVTAQDEFGAIGDTDVRLLSRERVGALLYQFDLVEMWMNSVRAFAHQELEAGREIPGQKLVERAPRRKWKDLDAAIAWVKQKRIPLKEAFTERELKSVNQLEKVVGKKKLPTDLIEKVSSGLIMVEQSDPRPAVLLLGGGAEFSTEAE